MKQPQNKTGKKRYYGLIAQTNLFGFIITGGKGVLLEYQAGIIVTNNTKIKDIDGPMVNEYLRETQISRFWTLYQLLRNVGEYDYRYRK